jgi:hypothetical protein
MNINIKINSPKRIQSIFDTLQKVYFFEVSKIYSILREEFTERMIEKFENEINKNCWFKWTLERKRKKQKDYIELWIHKHFDLFCNPDYLLNLRTFNKSLGLLITDKQEEISIEVNSFEFEMMKNPLEKIESVREEYINTLVNYCYKYHKWS